MSDITIPGFEIIELIGCGGMAKVWKARQVSLDRTVAVKVLSAHFSSDASDVGRFQEEARAAARLKHPGIVQVYDASNQDGMYFFVMEYVAGYTVGKWLRRKGVLPESDALTVCECVADALDYAWGQAGIIHCDVKPDNVIVDSDGTVKVADLGLSRTINAMARREEDPDEVMGTPAYISPEQAMGKADLDCRADIYSLGAMLYHLVTGRRPFEGHADEDVMERQCTGELDGVAEIRPSVSAPVCMLIEKMMARNRDDRHADWHAVKSDIARVKRGHPPRLVLAPTAECTVRRSPQTRTYHRPDSIHNNLERWKHSDATMHALLWVAGGLCLVVLLLWLIVNAARGPTSGTAPPRGEPVPRAEDEQVSPDGTQSPRTRATPPERARQAYDAARKWIEAHPDNVAGAIRRLKSTRPLVGNTRYAVTIERDLQRFKQQQTAARREVMSELEARARRHEEAGEWQRAARVFTDYSDSFAEETEEWRLDMAARSRERALAAARPVDEDDPPTPPFDMEVAMSRVVETLLDAGPSAAARVVRQASKQAPEGGAPRKSLERLQQTLLAAARLDDRILSSFEDQIGEDVAVHLSSGKKTVHIKSVSDGYVQGELPVRPEGVVDLPIRFAVSDLYITERLRRMGDDGDPEVALVKGMMALDAGALSRAAEFFDRTDPLLAGRLLVHVCDLRKLAAAAPSRPPQTAHDEGVAATDGGDVDLPSELDAVRDDAHGVKRLLLEKNTKLNPDDLTITDPADGPVAVVIRSAEITDIGPLAALTTLAQLRVVPPRGERARLRDLEALSDLPLKTIDLERCRVDDLSALSGLPVVSLSVAGSSVRNLQPLRGLPLTSLNIRETGVLDITCLGQLPLKSIDLSHTSVRRLISLSSMPLEDVNVSGCPITDLGFVKGLRLRSLALADTSVRDISVLAAMPLQDLDMSRTRVTDFSPLAGLPLKALSLAGVPARDFGVLRGMQLERLDVSDSAFDDVGLLAGMPLKTLHMNGTRVDDLWALKGKPLEHLFINDSPVADVEPLKGCPLEVFDCCGTRILDYSPLHGAGIVKLRIDNPRRRAAFIHSLPRLVFLNGENLRYASGSPFRRTRRTKQGRRRPGL